MQNIFKGMKVVELASVLAGPAVGTFFSELGADVLKVENKTAGGDVTRQWRMSGEQEAGPSAYYASVNWNKKSVMLDLGDKSDREEALRLVREADIVLSNFKRGDGRKFGLDYEQVKRENPSVIYGQLTGFGSESDRLAYDLIMQAETGFMSMNGQPGGPPTKMPVALIDVLAAHQLKEGILCALLQQRERPDRPFHVQVSLYDSAVSSLINQAANWLMNDNVPQRLGSRHPNIAPYGDIFTTRDKRSVTLAVGSDRQFRDLCTILKLPELARQPSYRTNAARVEHRSPLATALQQQIARMDSDSLLQQCRRHRVPAAAIKNLEEVFSAPSARRLLLTEEREGRATVRPRTAVFELES